MGFFVKLNILQAYCLATCKCPCENVVMMNEQGIQLVRNIEHLQGTMIKKCSGFFEFCGFFFPHKGSYREPNYILQNCAHKLPKQSIFFEKKMFSPP